MLTQWYENGDGVTICSTNGLRPDHPQADLVVTKLLLAESGHYILPVNQVDQTMTEDEKTEILRLWRCKKKTGQAAAREQSDNCHHHDNSLNIDSNKLQFNTETLKSELSSLPEPKMNDNIHNDVKISMKVDDTEPAIQVLKVDTMDEEYDETQQSYPGDQFPAHLPNGKLKYLSKLYKAIPEEFYTKTRRAPVTPRNARSCMGTKPEELSLPPLGVLQRLWKTVFSGSVRWLDGDVSPGLPVRLGSWMLLTSQAD
jgi:hypothetical protein